MRKNVHPIMNDFHEINTQNLCLKMTLPRRIQRHEICSPVLWEKPVALNPCVCLLAHWWSNFDDINELITRSQIHKTGSLHFCVPEYMSRASGSNYHTPSLLFRKSTFRSRSCRLYVYHQGPLSTTLLAKNNIGCKNAVLRHHQFWIRQRQ